MNATSCLLRVEARLVLLGRGTNQKLWSEWICALKPFLLMVASLCSLLGDVVLVSVEKLFLYWDGGT